MITKFDALLDELAAEAPVDRGDWPDVVARTRNLRRRDRRRRPAVVVVAVAAVLILTGTAIGLGTTLLTQSERFHANLPDDPKRLSPAEEIASGDGWALIAWRSDNGICLDFAVSGNLAFGCDFPVRGAKPPSNTLGSGPPIHAVGGFISFPGLVGLKDSKTTIFGVAARDVASVEIELRDGRMVKPQLYDAPPSLGANVKFFIVRLPLATPPIIDGKNPSPVRFYNAYDLKGALIEHVRD